MVARSKSLAVDLVPVAVRAGTATRRAGQETSARIVAAAQTLLCREEYVPFTMRAVAVAAGIGLANLQYYFASREDLIHAVFNDIAARYAESYEQLLEGKQIDPRERLELVLRWNFADIVRRETRQLFIRLWELVSSMDGFSGRLLGELYQLDVDMLANCIREVHPKLADGELRMRATILAAMIEGLMVVQGEPRPAEAMSRRMIQRLLKQSFAIVDGVGIVP